MLSHTGSSLLVVLVALCCLFSVFNDDQVANIDFFHQDPSLMLVRPAAVSEIERLWSHAVAYGVESACRACRACCLFSVFDADQVASINFSTKTLPSLMLRRAAGVPDHM